jgi:hypothetical protein
MWRSGFDPVLCRLRWWAFGDHRCRAAKSRKSGNNGELLTTIKRVAAGKVTRYKMQSIRERKGKFVFLERAFGTDLAKFDPVPPPALESIDATHTNFEGLKFTRTAKDAMTAIVAALNPDGRRRAVKIDSVRVLKFAPS